MEWFAAPGHDLARLLVQRGIGVVYLLAFTNVLVEWRPLLGDRGLLPATRVVARVAFRRAPSLLHWRADDGTAMAMAWTGVALSAFAVLGAPAVLPWWATMALWLAIWGLYLSFVSVGQVFYAFGWESILLEAGFLVAFLGADDVAPPVLTLWLLRWLLFRIEFGAGLIKLRGDRCWRDLTCLDFHHETQPLPGPLSWRFHHLPGWMHRAETGANHVVQLVVPWLLFAPQPVAGWAAAAIVATQLWLMASGNFAWLNALTIVLAGSAVPDTWAGAVGLGELDGATSTPLGIVVAVVTATAAVVVLSWWPVRNMASRGQRMNATWNPLHLVNSYGAFGSVTRVRHEVVVEGTLDDDPEAAQWRAYEFHAKPGAVDRRPPQVAPFHRRLDWLLWFAALSDPARHPWMLALLDHLLAGDERLSRLVRLDPFEGVRPRWVRVRRYRYRYTTPSERRRTGAWWVRDLVGTDVVPRRAAEAG